MGLTGREKNELRILTPIGMLGQGFSEKVVWDAVQMEGGIDAIIADSGSTDSGPGRLANGTLSVPVANFERDLGILVRACHAYHVPVLIGSAGGDGEKKFVDLLIEIVQKAIKDNGYRTMKVIGIYSEIPKEHVHQKLADGLISSCGSGVPQLTDHDINTATTIVAQMGHEPYLMAMQEHPDFDIIIGGRAYDPAPYTAFCLHKGFNNMGTNYAMGKIMECGAGCADPKSREALAIVSDDYFDVVALDGRSRMTAVSVAAHFLYEKASPDILRGPGGALHLSDTTYEQVEHNRVRVRGAKWIAEPEGEYTLKLEAARSTGFYTSLVGAFRDPILISQLDDFIHRIELAVREKLRGLEYKVKIHRYGINGVMGQLEFDKSLSKEVCIVVQACAATQELATQVASSFKFGLTHMPYKGQLATGGNFAWPLTPCETPGGPLAEFCIYHIMHKSDPIALFPIKANIFEGANSYSHPKTDASVGNKPTSISAAPTTQKSVSTTPPTVRSYYLHPEPEAGTCYLGDIASVIRSKNAGPYELTFDIMFDNKEMYERVKATGVLNRETIAKLYSLAEKDIVASIFWDPAMAYKATIVRPAVSGGYGETDTHGSQQHVPLMYIKVPIPRE